MKYKPGTLLKNEAETYYLVLGYKQESYNIYSYFINQSLFINKHIVESDLKPLETILNDKY